MKTLEQLANDLYDAKREEDAAKAKRIEVEEAIAAQVETGDNGSKTVTAGPLKLTVKRGLIYKADVDAMREIGETEMPNGVALPLKYVPPVAATYEFDEKAYERMRDIAPDAYQRVAMFVATKPRKVAVELKLA